MKVPLGARGICLLDDAEDSPIVDERGAANQWKQVLVSHITGN